jgi:serine/threonine-protein kinase
VLRAVPKEVAPTALVAYLANYFDLFWVLDEDQQRLVLRLTPRPFDNNRAQWGLSLAETYALRGDSVRARAYADSARVVYEAQLKEAPDDAQLHAIHGLMLAYLGRRAEAVREGRRAVSLVPVTKDAFIRGPYLQHQLARIYILVGEPEKALDELEPLLKMPYYLSPAWLRIDPTFAPLRGIPRFQRLVEGR